MKRKSFLILAMALLTADAHAETGQTFVIGAGNESSCGKFIAAISDLPPGKYREVNGAKGSIFVSENKAYQEWLMGFVSGFNAAHAGDLEQQITKIDPAGLDLWMRNWCNKYPTYSVFDGASKFIAETTARRP
jgi:hypothetical protein